MSSNQHSRRDFLRGKAAVAAAAEVIESAIDANLPEEPPRPAQLARVLTLTRRAMACDFELRLCVSSEQNDTAAGMSALDLVERLEDQLTVYRDQSELIDLNCTADDGPVEVEERLFELFQLCDRLHRQTDGAFDPTSGPLSRVWGFHRRAGRVPGEGELADALKRVGWRAVRLGEDEPTVRFSTPGVEVNMNSIGKGYALDRAAEVLAEQGVSDSLMHGGRSTLLARGSNHALASGGWQAGLRNPLHPDRRLASFTLHDEALSTSGSGTQFFEHEGKRFGHLIDPRTGWPAEGLYSATVLAPTAAEADALSTAAYILGVEGAERMCDAHPEIRALLVAPDGDGGLQTHPFNLEESQWRPDANCS